MPRVKKFRLSPPKANKRRATLPPNGVQVNEGNNVTLAAAKAELPMMYCVVCYNEFTFYTLNCASWESCVTRDFYVALNIPSDTDSVVALPFCPECHSKVSVMFSLHQQLQNILQNFNCVRNDLAFTVVDTINKNCRKGPLDLIRTQIFDRWKELYAKAKASSTPDVHDPKSTFDYLQPKLSVADEFPSDSKSMSISHAAKQHLAELRKTPAMINKHHHSFSKMRPTVPHSDKKDHTSIIPIVTKTQTTPSFDMPVLEPMGHVLPSKSPITHVIATNGKSRIGRPPNSTRKNALIRKAVPSKINRGKKLQPKPNTVHSISDHFNPNVANKKAHKKLANGFWKCNYCPMGYAQKVRVSQHESRCHPQTRPFLCKLCPKGFSGVEGLRRHLESWHNQVMEGFVQCPYCVRNFGRKSSFDQHIKNLHKGRKIPDFNKEKNKSTKQPVKVQLPTTSPPSPEITDLESTKSSSPETKKRVIALSPIPRKKARRTLVLESLAPPTKRARKSNRSDDLPTTGDHDVSNKTVQTEDDAASKQNGNMTDHVIVNNPSTPTLETDVSNDDKKVPVLPANLEKTKPSPPFICKICGKSYPHQQGLAGHTKSHRGSSSKTSAVKRSGTEDAAKNTSVTEVPVNGST